MDDLDSLLGQAMAEKKERDKQKAEDDALIAARKRLAGLSGNAAERAADAELIKTWEDRHVWNTTASAFLFETLDCVCGHKSEPIFMGIYATMVHKHNASTKRIVAIDSNDPDLPTVTYSRTRYVGVCCACASECDVDFTMAQPWPVGDSDD